MLQHVNSNYEIDLFRTLIAAVAKVTGATDLDNKSLRVIADHIRSCAFPVSDGVIPSNENRGYVLRRIIRRAIRHGNMLGAKDTFFYKLVAPLIEVMGPAADELKRQQSLVEQVLKPKKSSLPARWSVVWRCWTKSWPSCRAIPWMAKPLSVCTIPTASQSI